MVNRIENIDFNGYVIAAVEGHGDCLHVLRFWKSNKSDYGEWKDSDKLSEATFYKTSNKAEIALRRKNGYLKLAMDELKESLKDTFPDVEFQVMQIHGMVTLNRMFTL